MKLSEEVDGQVTSEWRSCESDQGGSSAIGSLTDDLGYFCLPLWKGDQYEKEEEERYKAVEAEVELELYHRQRLLSSYGQENMELINLFLEILHCLNMLLILDCVL
ncbi:unnamed protein product [Prunus armeniaca]